MDQGLRCSAHIQACPQVIPLRESLELMTGVEPAVFNCRFTRAVLSPLSHISKFWSYRRDSNPWCLYSCLQDRCSRRCATIAKLNLWIDINFYAINSFALVVGFDQNLAANFMKTIICLCHFSH
jgi:hypothetical protein